MRSSMLDALVARSRRAIAFLAATLLVLVATAGSVQASPLATGGNVACAVAATGNVECDRDLDFAWGQGGGPTSPFDYYGAGQASQSITDAWHVAAAGNSACVLRRTGRVTCFGDGYAGTMATESSSYGLRRYGLSDVQIAPARAIAAGPDHACAALRSGEAWCWGSVDLHGAFGDGSTRGPYQSPHPLDLGGGGDDFSWDQYDPVRVLGISDAVDIGAGGQHSCAVLADGGVRCWGAGARGQLGSGATSDSPSPVAVAGLSDARAITLGADHTCALRAAGQVVCWGAGNHGQLGNGGRADQTSPVAVDGLHDAIAVAAGDAFTCALRASATVVCWGQGNQGRIGDGGNVDRTTPRTIDGLTGVRAIGAGAASGRACAAAPANVVCWGSGYSDTYQSHDQHFDHEVRPHTTVRGITDAKRVQAGRKSTCVERAGGKLSCWGSWRNAAGDLRPLATPVTLPFSIVDLALVPESADLPSCAATTQGDLRCWDALDADGTPRTAAPSSAGGLTTDGLDGVTSVALSAGRFDPFGCAVVTGGAVRCWTIVRSAGRTQFGASFPIPGIAGAVDVVAAGALACARIRDQTVQCWAAADHQSFAVDRLAGSSDISMVGGNVCGEQHPGTQATCRFVQFDPYASTDRIGFGSLTLGGVLPDALPWKRTDDALCAVSSGRVKCNEYMPVGSDYEIPVFRAYTVKGVANATSLATNGHSCAVLRDGTVRCWGPDRDGQAGDGFGPTGHALRIGRPVVANLPEQVYVPATSGASTIAAGTRHSCAVRGDGALRCWGSGADGRLGTGSKGDRLKPTRVAAISDARSVAVGDRHSCAVVADQTVRCWGLNYYGQLGDGHTGWAYKPVAVDGLTGVQQVAVGDRHTCALRSSGSVFCWGLGLSGRLGDGENRTSGTPVKVSGLSDAVAISAGSRSTCAVRATGAVVCWGAGVDGRLGDGSTAVASTPALVTGITTATSVAVGDGHACAVLTSGEVRCWGRGGSGQLGDGTSTDRPTPVSVAGIDSAAQVVTGASHTCALLYGGTMRCWGDGAGGQLGQGTTERSATPVGVNEIDDATGIAAGGSHTCVRRFRNPPACFGHNIYAQLGGGNTVSSSSPVDVLGGLSQIAY